MTETLSIPNFTDNNVLLELELSADAAPQQSIISLLNVDTAMDEDYLCIDPATKLGELGVIINISTNPQQATLGSNLLVQHRNHAKVYKLFGNQIQVYKAPNVDGTVPDDTAFSAYGSPVNIDPTIPYTYFTDTNGGNGWWYKFAYYNSTTTSITDLSLAEAIRGGGYGNYVSIEEVRNESGIMDTRMLGDDDISARRAAAESKIKSALASAGYVMPLQTGSGVFFIPELIRDIARRYAAGLVLMRNFGTTKPGSAKDGKAKIDSAKEDLAEIQLTDNVLLDSNEQPLAKVALVLGWPDNTTADNGITVGPTITMDKIF